MQKNVFVWKTMFFQTSTFFDTFSETQTFFQSTQGNALLVWPSGPS